MLKSSGDEASPCFRPFPVQLLHCFLYITVIIKTGSSSSNNQGQNLTLGLEA